LFISVLAVFYSELGYVECGKACCPVLAVGSYWLYEYDRLGQVIAGRKYWPDRTPVAGQQFEYGFDDIGNRKVARRGGDENGWNLRQSLYSANLLNQYSQRTAPGFVDILGIALANKAVYVNGQLAYRKGEYFRKELSVNNASAPVWQQVTVTASGEPTVTGNLFVPRTPEPFSYDLDGNMTSDGRWNYTWDADNRLVKVESRSDTPQASWRRLEWPFDALGRRIQQRTLVWTNNAWALVEDLKFISDPLLFGRHIAELHASDNTLVRSYVWGLDLSGSLDGGGGVGGLLWVTLHTASAAAPGTHFAAYDGNGNVVALVRATTGTETACYEYGPFGEPIRVSGHAAALNPFRFSTKRTDSTADLVLYEYRVYQPSRGRWVSIDPIGERGGLNLYGFVGNNPASRVDPLGLSYYGGGGADFKEKLACVCAGGISKCNKAAQLASDALAEAQKRFPADSLHNGVGDAWRHCYWSGEMAKAIGQECAKIIGDIHEDAGDRKGQPKNERDMDEHNNSVGRGLALQSGNCADRCQQALKDGKLKTLK
jgi:RHS repeat-associated protein